MKKKAVMNECIEDLAQAIILQAIEDYRQATMILDWYREQKKKEKTRRLELKKIRKKAKKTEWVPGSGGSAEREAGREPGRDKRTAPLSCRMGKEARRMADATRKKAEKKRQKRDELIRAARQRKREVERFLHSNWFRMMSDIEMERMLTKGEDTSPPGTVPLSCK